MSRQYPHFRLFLFGADAVFVALSVFAYAPPSPPQVYHARTLGNLLENLFLLVYFLSLMPLVCAVIFGSVGQQFLMQILWRERVKLGYGVILALFGLNTFVLSCVFSHELYWFGYQLDGTWLSFPFCVAAFFLTYGRSLFLSPPLSPE